MNSATPWHRREISAKDYEYFRNLSDLHSLTLNWLKELKLNTASFITVGGTSGGMQALDSLSNANLESLLDDTSPRDMLRRLEHTVIGVQATVLTQLLERTPEAERKILRGRLEQASWKNGKVSGELRWPMFELQMGVDVRKFLLTLADVPVFPSAGIDHFLTHRAIFNFAKIELRDCPHRSSYPETRAVSDELCFMHVQWIKGFAYALNKKLLIEYQPGNSKVNCSLDFALTQ